MSTTSIAIIVVIIVRQTQGRLQEQQCRLHAKERLWAHHEANGVPADICGQDLKGEAKDLLVGHRHL